MLLPVADIPLARLFRYSVTNYAVSTLLPARLGELARVWLLKRRDGVSATSDLYEGILRDLGVTDAEVEAYLAEHGEEVEQAIRSHGRRGD